LQAGLRPELTTEPKAETPFQFQNRLNAAQIVELCQLYQSEWWSRGRKLEDVRRVVEHSDLIFAFCKPESGHLVAFARVLTDYVFKALIFDVIVEPSHRGLGLGRSLLDAIVSHPALLFVEHLELYCRPEMVPFYGQWDFTAGLAQARFMRRTQEPW